jgi:hypothetical protein
MSEQRKETVMPFKKWLAMRQQRQSTIRRIKSAVQRGRMRFVHDPYSAIPGRFWIEMRHRDS